jgi:hypothetical protein
VNVWLRCGLPTKPHLAFTAPRDLAPGRSKFDKHRPLPKKKQQPRRDGSTTRHLTTTRGWISDGYSFWIFSLPLTWGQPQHCNLVALPKHGLLEFPCVQILITLPKNTKSSSSNSWTLPFTWRCVTSEWFRLPSVWARLGFFLFIGVGRLGLLSQKKKKKKKPWA